MKYNHNKTLVPNAKDLRKNMTKEERHLWYDYLRSQKVRFVRQKNNRQIYCGFLLCKGKIGY